MSILKSIFHHWNKTTNSYDTLHPETEVAQITDFADGIVSKLASTTAISAISALQTDSWFGKMMKWVLDASGVKYLIATTGYVCFGSLFGGLIIQWGVAGGISHFPNKKTKFVCPIAFTNACHVAFATDTGAAVLVYGVTIDSLTTLTIYNKIEASDFGSAYVLAIGK